MILIIYAIIYFMVWGIAREVLYAKYKPLFNASYFSLPLLGEQREQWMAHYKKHEKRWKSFDNWMFSMLVISCYVLGYFIYYF